MAEIMVGRVKEREDLKKYLASKRSEFIAVYGRRRVGKTFFIRQIIGDIQSFTFTGMKNAGLTEQLSNFYFNLRRVYPAAKLPKSWLEAFDMLQSFLIQCNKQPKIVFIDELPWLDTVRANFVSALEQFWNGWASAQNNVKLIVCGSATSWIIDNLINNRGGLHNRVTHQISLNPFTLGESREYFKKYGFNYSNMEVAECQMIFGGVPFYYSLMDNSLSVAQNVDNLYFRKNGELCNEFSNLYKSLFKHPDGYESIITAMASKLKGLTRKEIIKISGLNNNLKLSVMLQELEKCGFIRCYIPFGNTKRDVLYQIVDAFTLFHLKFYSYNKYEDEEFWLHFVNSLKHNSWAGYAFEMLCLNHIAKIKQALGISGVQSRVCCWSARADDETAGTQIDMLIDRADNTVNICEIKFSNSVYKISKTDNENFNNKIETFINKTSTNKSLIFTMITSKGLSANKYSNVVQKLITLNDLF